MPQFVVKVASRCNIACTYCYMYYRGDDQSLRRPKFLSKENVDLLTRRLAEHSDRSKDTISVSLHGGEPLLYGLQRTEYLLRSLRSALARRVRFTIQTNGLLLNEHWYALFEKFDVSVGISLDGTREMHDRHRLNHRGDGTFDATIRAIEKIQKQSSVRFGGIISVLDCPTADAKAYYNLIKALDLPAFNVLLPDVDHDNYATYNEHPPLAYSGFLKALFDLWVLDENAPHNRLFEAIASKVVGGKSGSESVGTFNAPSIIVETDGSIQAHDVARMNTPGRTHPFSLANSSIENFIDNDALYGEASRSDFTAPAVKCEKCPVYHICRAGFWPHRYSAQNGYENHSVYCDALFDLIAHIYFKLLSSTARSGAEGLAAHA